MAEVSDHQEDTNKGKEKEPNQDEDGIQDDTESAADTETEDEEDDDDDEDEPKLKYARMTGQLGAVYRNGDAMSAFLVAGNKMLIGTHNGNIHVLSLPSFESLRVYTAHSASVTSISISPFPPPLPSPLPAAVSRIASQAQPAKRAPSITSDATAKVPRTPKVPTIPNIPSNAIYIATSSMDGKVCIVSLVDMKDVQVRNFARPVQAVSLSPDYKNDRTYVSGGLAGNLVLTVGGKSGTSSTSTTVGTASATASGWLGSIGIGGNAGQDTVLHSGEGTISTIKWSLTGKYVVWVNEHGVRIMRSHLHLESTDSGSAWKRIGHVGRPQDNGWEEMAGVWKARVEWIDEAALETDEDDKARETVVSTPATMKLKQQVSKSSSRIEKLVIGWGGTVWIINVHPEGPGVGTRERSVGRAEIIKILRMDCIISGLSLYTPTLLLVLAYMQPDKDVEEDGEETEEKNNAKVSSGKGHKSQLSTASTGSEPRGGIRRRANALSPELRLIDLRSSEEVDTDQLTVSRFERLSSSDYHLGVLPAANNLPMTRTPRGTLETLTGMGSSLWSATINATSLLSSSASVHSTGSNSEKGSSRAHGSASGPGLSSSSRNPVHPDLAAPGMKIFIHSPYDCILATKRDLSDHLSFLLEHHKYQQSWELIDESPEVISTSPQKLVEIGPASTDQARDMKDDFYDDITSTADSAARLINSSVEKEKRRIGELWIQQLVQQGDWVTAGSVCGKVLGTSTQWKEWVYRFAAAKKFDEIVNFIPSTQVQPPLDSTIYEVVLGYYITYDRLRARELLEHWSPDLFNIRSVTTILENQLKYRDVREDSIEYGEAGRDWRVIVESLAKLYVADGRPREALKYYVKLRDADMAMSLIKDYHLVDAVAEDITGFILLRVTDEQKSTAPIEELSEATSEAINLLVLEAQHGLIQPSVVVNQLQEKLPLYLFFYLRSLWKGDAIQEQNLETHDRLVAESKALVDAFADLAVHLFALYDRNLLMEFLKSSTYYTFEKATAECEDNDFVPELVYLYSKTGQTKRALYLIIDRLADVSQAISFAKEQDDTDLWEDLLDYSMDKPRFIRGLLEEVGTAIDPITLVRRIPEGLAIEGLRDGLSRMIKEYELQHSISYGVAKVLRSEVRLVQNTLRSGQRKGVKFDVAGQPGEDHEDVKVPDSLVDTDAPAAMMPHEVDNTRKAPRAGHCVGCHEPFTEHEAETLVGFACGHIFHLSHLLSFIHDDRPVTPPDLELDENREATMTYSIGAKVTHARLLKDRIKDGCPLCVTKTKM